MEVKDCSSIPVSVYKTIAPWLEQYFAITKEEMSDIIHISFNTLYHTLADYKRISQEPYITKRMSTFGSEPAISHSPLDYRRYMPREEKEIEVLDKEALWLDHIEVILFTDLDIQTEEVYLKKLLPYIDEQDINVVYAIIVLIALVKRELKKRDLEKREQKHVISESEMESYEIITYMKEIRPEMLQLYTLLNDNTATKKGKLRPITINNGRKKVTIKNTERWLSDLLEDYLHIYLGVESKEEAILEIKENYSASKGRKDDPLHTLVMVGTYRLLREQSSIKTDADIKRFVIDLLELLDIAGENDDENNIGSKISYFLKHNYKPYWPNKKYGNYRFSPNNPCNSFLW